MHAIPDDVVAIIFDFMQNLSLPHIPVQKRQLTFSYGNYRFIVLVKDIKTSKLIFYMYPEDISNKGANEVCSMLLHYIENNIESHIEHLHLV